MRPDDTSSETQSKEGKGFRSRVTFGLNLIWTGVSTSLSISFLNWKMSPFGVHMVMPLTLPWALN